MEFLVEGLGEVQRAAEFVYTENMDLRARMEMLKALTTKIAETVDLPDELRADLNAVLEGALPPRDALEDSYEGSDAEKVQKFMESGYGFAQRVQDLWNILDDFRVSRARSPTGSSPKCEQEPLALEDEDAGLLNRARLVCRELVTGW